MNQCVSLIIPPGTETETIADVVATIPDYVGEVAVVMLDGDGPADGEEIARFVRALAEGAGYPLLSPALAAAT
jgi:hypothetical protein